MPSGEIDIVAVVRILIALSLINHDHGIASALQLYLHQGYYQHMVVVIITIAIVIISSGLNKVSDHYVNFAEALHLL